MSIKEMQEYIKKICDWSDRINLTNGGTLEGQFEKINEEMHELISAVYEFDKENDK